MAYHKKQLTELAAILASNYGLDDTQTTLEELRRDIAYQIAAYAEEQNPRFNKVRFFTACKIPVPL